MNTNCDIFLVSSLQGDSVLLRQLKIFQPNFSPEHGRDYQGFLGLSIPRLKAVAVVTHLRKSGTAAFSVPTKYRDSRRLSVEEAQVLAKAKVLAVVGNVPSKNPMFYVFQSAAKSSPEEGGGMVTIDALDGHKWTGDEMAEYMYDFNNVI